MQSTNHQFCSSLYCDGLLAPLHQFLQSCTGIEGGSVMRGCASRSQFCVLCSNASKFRCTADPTDACQHAAVQQASCLVVQIAPERAAKPNRLSAFHQYVRTLHHVATLTAALQHLPLSQSAETQAAKP